MRVVPGCGGSFASNSFGSHPPIFRKRSLNRNHLREFGQQTRMSNFD
jgi:hypothetical protein